MKEKNKTPEEKKDQVELQPEFEELSTEEILIRNRKTPFNPKANFYTRRRRGGRDTLT